MNQWKLDGTVTYLEEKKSILRSIMKWIPEY